MLIGPNWNGCKVKGNTGSSKEYFLLDISPLIDTIHLPDFIVVRQITINVGILMLERLNSIQNGVRYLIRIIIVGRWKQFANFTA